MELIVAQSLKGIIDRASKRREALKQRRTMQHTN